MDRRRESSDYLIRSIADATGRDLGLLCDLKQHMDLGLYHFGAHFERPHERQEENPVAQLEELSLLLRCAIDSTPRVSPAEQPVVLCAAFDAQWREQFRSAQLLTHPALWLQGSEIQEPVSRLMQCAERCVSTATFSLLIDAVFHDLLMFLKRLLEDHYTAVHPRAFLLRSAESFFERSICAVAHRIGTESFLFVDGFPLHYALLGALGSVVDYFCVAGQGIAERLVRAGVAAQRVLVTGHPGSLASNCRELRFDVQNVVVCTRPPLRAPLGNAPMYQNRGNALHYAYRVELALRALGIDGATLLCDREESSEWYREHMDRGFFRRISSDTPSVLGDATLVVGPAGPVFLETLTSGVNYLVFEPAADYNPAKYDAYYPAWPFDGSEAGIPVARTEEELAEIISKSRGVAAGFINANCEPLSIAPLLAKLSR